MMRVDLKFTLLCFVLVFNVRILFGQAVCDTDKEIRTRPDDAYNLESPSKRNSDPVIFD